MLLSLFNTAYMKAASLKTAVNGFKACGIHPYDPDVFDDSVFAPAEVTDKPDPAEVTEEPSIEKGVDTDASKEIPQPSTSAVPDTNNTHEPQPSCSHHPDISASVSFAALLPVPKCAPYAARPKRRKSSVSTELTGSPHRNLLTEAVQSRPRTTPVKPKSSRSKGKGKQPKRITNKRKRKQPDTDSSDDEEWPCLVCCEPYSNSKAGEIWVKCFGCKGWAHQDCTAITGKSIVYICHNCESDDDLI